MDFRRRIRSTLPFLVLAVSLEAAPAPANIKLPRPASQNVDFARDIKPLLEAACIKCHAHGQNKGGFQIDTRETILKGGETGPGAVPAQSDESYLVQLVAGADPDKIMPQKRTRLTAEEIGLLRAWIEQGMRWGENVVFRRARQAPLAPRRPSLPAGARDANPINLFVQAYYRSEEHTSELQS